MSCEPWQVALSARLDGEDPGMEPRLLDAHLDSCADCRRYLAIAELTRRSARVQPAPTMPDVSRRVVKLGQLVDRASRWSLVRLALFLVAVDVIVFSLDALVFGQEDDATAHAARHLGSFSFAYGVGLLVVVVRPARARTMLPVAMVLAGALAITSVIDLANGSVPLLGEATHLPEVISVLLIYLLAVPARRPRDRRGVTPVLPPAGAAGASWADAARGRRAGRDGSTHRQDRPTG